MNTKLETVMETNLDTCTDGYTVEAAPHVSVADLGGDAVLLDSASGEYFGLNEVGARIFHLAQRTSTIEQILDAVYKEFDVDRARLKADTFAFISEMEARRLIRLKNES